MEKTVVKACIFFISVILLGRMDKSIELRHRKTLPKTTPAGTGLPAELSLPR